MRSLKDTPLELVYYTFGVKDDVELCARMTNIGLLYTVIVGAYSIFQPAPYGRYAKSIYGPTINAKLGWMAQECMSFIFPVIIITMTPGIQLDSLPNILAIFLFMLHYFHRSFIYPTIMSKDAKPTPIATVIFAMLFCSYNGILQGVHLINVMQVRDSANVFAGTVLFLMGMAINMIHDRKLISLRKPQLKEKESEMTKYKIPRGGLFEYVSGANYFGEILEWMGLAILTLGYPQIAFSIFSAVFLGVRAVHHHRFYKETFGTTYPPSRKAILPFLL